MANRAKLRNKHSGKNKKKKKLNLNTYGLPVRKGASAGRQQAAGRY